MCKKKVKAEAAPVATKQDELDTLANFELKKPEPSFDENGNRDYFTEYYNAYKNDYIDQYLDAYKKLKESGQLDNPVLVTDKTDEVKDELDD